jgi:hypothetical protein
VGTLRVSDPSDVVDFKSAVAFVQQLTGHRPHLSTLHRWALKGRLAVHRVGCKVFTTKSALRELLEADASRPPATRDRREVERRGLEAAARIAGKAGA